MKSKGKGDKIESRDLITDPKAEGKRGNKGKKSVLPKAP